MHGRIIEVVEMCGWVGQLLTTLMIHVIHEKKIRFLNEQFLNDRGV